VKERESKVRGKSRCEIQIQKRDYRESEVCKRERERERETERETGREIPLMKEK
jgi:hypothetical protein